ncbi:hypothetical protein ABO04_10240 [Nitrosomonas sp. HPC101]|nr:hypothetical protein [Nitrosomonas sp. HPC101]
MNKNREKTIKNDPFDIFFNNMSLRIVQAGVKSDSRWRQTPLNWYHPFDTSWSNSLGIAMIKPDVSSK